MKNFLWIIPFISFLVGYLIMNFLYQPRFALTPHMVGKPIAQALSIAAAQGLSIRLINEKEDPDLPIGTVISQNPLPATKIKPHQAISCIISKKNDFKVPSLIGKTEGDIKTELTAGNVSFKIHMIASKAPMGTCIAQTPPPGTSLNSRTIIVYIAQDSSMPYIFPDLRQKEVETVKAFLEHSPVTIHISHASEQPPEHDCCQCIVSDQRPRPGTIVYLDKQKPIQIQLIATPVVQSNFTEAYQ